MKLDMGAAGERAARVAAAVVEEAVCGTNRWTAAADARLLGAIKF